MDLVNFDEAMQVMDSLSWDKEDRLGSSLSLSNELSFPPTVSRGVGKFVVVMVTVGVVVVAVLAVVVVERLAFDFDSDSDLDSGIDTDTDIGFNFDFDLLDFNLDLDFGLEYNGKVCISLS